MKQNKNTKTATTINTAPTFADLLRAYEQYANNPTADPTAKPLTDLATACAFSVLKKCLDVSQDRTLAKARQDLTKDLHNLDRQAYAGNRATALRYNEKGDLCRVVVDKDLRKAFEKACTQTFGDGYALVHDAVVCILTETEKAKDRNGGMLPPAFMEQTYQERRLSRKVWIKVEESVNGWETVDTTAIQETYKAIRRAIDQNGALKTTANNPYTYLTDLATDPETSVDTVIYHRYGKYADIGGYATDINGKTDYNSTYTANEQTATAITLTMEAVIEKLNLTERQAEIINLRMQGYGYKAIATRLGVSFQAVQNALYKVQNKCAVIGFTPSMWAEMTADK